MSEKLSEYCRRQASRPCPEDYGFNVEWNLAADDALALEAKLEAMGRDYYELIYAVSTKHEGETRHETALRYIHQAETSTSNVGTVAAAQEEKE